MVTYGWTKPLPIASLRADPSGIQDTGTVLQALLLPGMSTVTPNVRYLSLFTAAQYWRHDASRQGHKLIDYKEFLRRFEALIALSSVLHHDDPKAIPSGVVGRTYADSEVSRQRLRLNTGLQIPPYNIYRGTLGDLGLFDLSSRDDPLFESAASIGKAWNIRAAGFLGDQLKRGTLPETVHHRDLKAVAGCFCLCTVPQNSAEQRSLVELLFGLGRRVDKPNFDSEVWDPHAIRVASWRLLLEVVRHSEERSLYEHYLMGRLLEADLVGMNTVEILRDTLFFWRWVAARSFFELGWTIAFNHAFDVIRSSPYGLSHNELLKLTENQYYADSGQDKLTDLMNQAEANRRSGVWMAEMFGNPTVRDCVSLMLCGVLTSREDLSGSNLKMLSLIDSERQIPFQIERERIKQGLHKGLRAAEYWAEITSETLIQHTGIALRKMGQGLPDTQHVEFEDGRWKVPPGRDSWTPRPSTGFSRLDIALGWLHQLGLVDLYENGSYSLTDYGESVRRSWDKVYQSWE